MSLLEVSGLSKTYTTRFGGAKVEALKSVTFSVESGESVAVMGESGSGKTTLLNLLAALDRPTGGTVLLGGQNLAEIPEERAAAFRRDHLGFVFQDFSLLDTFSLEDNILLPLVLQGKSRGEMKSRLVPARRPARHFRPAQKIPLRGLRRPEAARRRGPRAHHAPAGSLCRRADRCARLRLHRGAAPSLRHGQRRGADHRHGHALRPRGQLCGPCPLPARRRRRTGAHARHGHGDRLLPPHRRRAHCVPDGGGAA